MNQKKQNGGGSMKDAAKQAAENQQKDADDKPAETPAAEKPAETQQSTTDAAKTEDLSKLSQEELLERLRQLEADNKRLGQENQGLKDAAVESATEISELRKMSLAPTTSSSGVYQCSLKSNPDMFVRANNVGEAQRIYFDYFGINSSAHQFGCSPVDEVPEDGKVIYVDESGKVCCQVSEDKLLVAEA